MQAPGGEGATDPRTASAAPGPMKASASGQQARNVDACEGKLSRIGPRRCCCGGSSQWRPQRPPPQQRPRGGGGSADEDPLSGVGLPDAPGFGGFTGGTNGPVPELPVLVMVQLTGFAAA